MTVFAAGAVLWREDEGELKVLMVHRSRYNDWAWPKGKVDPGETLPETAVREVREETGLKINLGIKLPVLKYKLPNGEAKEVHYWAARVSDKALAKSKFKPDDEVAAVTWLSPSEARELFTYDADEPYLTIVENLFETKRLKTKPFVILRHAKATPRSDWKKGEATRPLLPIGTKQAKRLVPLLGAFGIKQVISSPWARCFETVKPFAKSKGLKIVERSQISEFGNHRGPQRTVKLIRNLVSEDTPLVVCSHRPALPTIFETLGKFGTADQAVALSHHSALKPGDFTVVHLTSATRKQKRSIVAIEQYSTGIDD